MGVILRIIIFIVQFQLRLNELNETTKPETEPFNDDNMFEGDMVGFNETTVKQLQDPQANFMSATEEDEKKWPDAIIPYVFQDSFSEKFLSNFNNAIKQIEAVTCIR